MRAGDPGAQYREATIVKLRTELVEAQQKLTEETSEKVRKQEVELRDARLAMLAMTRKDAAVCLDLRRANTQLS